ncbi:MAG: flavodoxin domain-containing protein, partial [Rubrobacteraceae bacterium]
MDKAVILVGTETGMAEDIADELAEAFSEVGIEAEIHDMEDVEPDVIDGDKALVMRTATHGDGELPDNSTEFYEAVEDESPDYSGVSFAVLGLGDSAYADFCEAGKIWSGFLAGLGAKEVVERYEIDGYPDDDDIEGAREWASEAAEKFAELV